MNSGVNLPPSQAAHCRFVEIAGSRKRRDERRARSRERRSHRYSPNPSTSFIVYQPLLPLIPCATTASNNTTPVEKFGAATTPEPASTTALRSAVSCSLQPVVPRTTLILRRANADTLLITAAGDVKSIATSTPRQRSDVTSSPPTSGSTTPATWQPYSPARLSTSLPIRP